MMTTMKKKESKETYFDFKLKNRNPFHLQHVQLVALQENSGSMLL